MTWQQVYQYSLVHSDVPVFIDYSFTIAPVIVKISSPREHEGYNKAGLIWLTNEIPEIGRVKSHPVKVYFDTQTIRIPTLENRVFSFEYLPWHYLRDITLSFYQNQPASTTSTPQSTQSEGDRQGSEQTTTTTSTSPESTTYTFGTFPGM